MRFNFLRFGALLVWLGTPFLARPQAASATRLTVNAGPHDRLGTLVSFSLPTGFEQLKGIKDRRGQITPVQIDESGTVSFFMDQCQKGAYNEYELTNLLPPGLNQDKVTAVPEGSAIRLMAERLAPIYYQTSPRTNLGPEIDIKFYRGGYLHPILSPSGLLVSDDYPPKHIHHHGLWWAWTKTKMGALEPDFWNMGEKKGTVEFAKLLSTWSGPVHAGLRTSHQYRELLTSSRDILLTETWDVRIYAAPKSYPLVTLLDLVCRQECATNLPLVLPKYYYGGLGFRGHRDWDGKENVMFLTSEGETNRVKGNESRGRWCHIGGKVDGKPTGIAILSHPENFRHPQPMRLHPDEPFLCFAPQQLGDMQIVPDKPFVSRYRLAVMDGPPNAKLIERLYTDYAYPPSARIIVP